MEIIIDEKAIKEWFIENETSYLTLTPKLKSAFKDTFSFDVYEPAVDGKFFIATTGLMGHSWEFATFVITSWDMNDNPVELEEYISGFIKWDGCSHFYFGEDQDGYLHLCGADDVINHAKLMVEIYKKATSLISTFDQSEKLVDKYSVII